jgi:extracellular elastinolytic metalloproteinase
VRRPGRSAVIAVLTLTTALTAAPTGASASPAPRQAPGDEYAFVDNRPGSAAPSSGQRSLVAGAGLAARWNRLGTPASLGAATGPLAAGLPGDPEAVARQYLKRSLGLFALRAADVDALETIARTPLGNGTVVLMRQRYGGLPAAHDGLVAVAVKGGDVLRPPGSAPPPR